MSWSLLAPLVLVAVGVLLFFLGLSRRRRPSLPAPPAPRVTVETALDLAHEQLDERAAEDRAEVRRAAAAPDPERAAAEVWNRRRGR